MHLETFTPRLGSRLKFLGNKKHYAEHMTVGKVYDVFLYNKTILFFVDDNGEKQFFDALIKSYWEEVKVETLQDLHGILSDEQFKIVKILIDEYEEQIEELENEIESLERQLEDL